MARDEDAGRPEDVAESRFGPAAAVGGALDAAVFLSEMEVALEGVGRFAGAKLAAALLGRALAAAVGLSAPGAGCGAAPRHTGAMEGKK